MAELRWLDDLQNKGLVSGSELYYHTAWCARCAATFVAICAKDSMSVEGWLKNHRHKQARLTMGRGDDRNTRGWYLRMPPNGYNIFFGGHPEVWFFWDFETAQKFINNGFKFKEEK